ncbi:Aste57867_22792 [Aphanomyces stellatus]|uniref:60S ribosomal export protein NMD3 n=1 Tax=Aphanomyces stellatus TaxID=120398 RepID=A0A485LQR9_9STRA|nr:hypothetical protein As57867_022722 [Aphanomyces stellatus]VFT99445.1 Aste57867_22792 [Aphanomyces stellatus]
MAIPCCVCGISIESNSANMCPTCLAAEVDITADIAKEGTLVQCRDCLRFQGVGKGNNVGFATCPLESIELMALCLKKIHGLTRHIQLVDAKFIWTDPQTKRIKLRLTIRKEVMRHAVLQTDCVITFAIDALQCPDCTTQARNAGVVQLRQKGNHKRAFDHLEQLILTHAAHKDAIDIVSEADGIDVFFAEKKSAERLVQFVGEHVPVRTKTMRQVVSVDSHSNTANVTLTIVAEIAPICKDDLVVLEARTTSLGARLVLVSHVTTHIHVVDPLTSRRAEIPAARYWKHPFDALQSATSLVEFIVLDVDLVDRHVQTHAMAIVQVARVSDFGVNDTTFHVTTHLGRILSAGDIVEGYDLGRGNIGALPVIKYDVPDIVLVRRSIADDENANIIELE